MCKLGRYCICTQNPAVETAPPNRTSVTTPSQMWIKSVFPYNSKCPFSLCRDIYRLFLKLSVQLDCTAPWLDRCWSLGAATGLDHWSRGAGTGLDGDSGLGLDSSSSCTGIIFFFWCCEPVLAVACGEKKKLILLTTWVPDYWLPEYFTIDYLCTWLLTTCVYEGRLPWGLQLSSRVVWLVRDWLPWLVVDISLLTADWWLDTDSVSSCPSPKNNIFYFFKLKTKMLKIKKL